MHGHLWSGRAFSGGPSFGTGKFLSSADVMGLSWSTVSDRVLFFHLIDEEKKCMLLVMRVLSIVPLNFKVR